jgi:hypothetical protein
VNKACPVKLINAYGEEIVDYLRILMVFDY